MKIKALGRGTLLLVDIDAVDDYCAKQVCLVYKNWLLEQNKNNAQRQELLHQLDHNFSFLLDGGPLPLSINKEALREASEVLLSEVYRFMVEDGVGVSCKKELLASFWESLTFEDILAFSPQAHVYPQLSKLNKEKREINAVYMRASCESKTETEAKAKLRAIAQEQLRVFEDEMVLPHDCFPNALKLCIKDKLNWARQMVARLVQERKNIEGVFVSIKGDGEEKDQPLIFAKDLKRKPGQ